MLLCAGMSSAEVLQSKGILANNWVDSDQSERPEMAAGNVQRMRQPQTRWRSHYTC